MRNRLIIAVDGPAGAGKTTLARRLAEALGLPHLNTGLMYRALAERAILGGVDLDDVDALTELVRQTRYEFDHEGELLVDGRRPGASLHRPAVDEAVPAVARHEDVRRILQERQRGLGGYGSVTEGRDIASRVFPRADVKIFLSADPTIRAARRRQQRSTGEPNVHDALVRRDARDASTNPLHPAAGAIVLESSNLSSDEVYAKALEIIEDALRNREPARLN